MFEMRLLMLCSMSTLLTAGCTNHYGMMPIQDDRGAYNAWTIETAFDSSARSAIITQRTLYPYHFVPDSPDLNELGRHDVEILAARLARRGGELSIRQGEEPDGLYEARMATVMMELSAAGVDPAAIRLGDEFPRGEGMRADQIIHILKQERTSPQLAPAATGIGIGGGQ
jgi:hypothetical protein